LKWNVGDLYATDADWESGFALAQDGVAAFAKHKGTLNSPSGLLNALCAQDALSLIVERLYVYASMRQDEDSANTFYQGLKDRADSMAVKMSAALSFMTPEILSIDEKELEGFFGKEDKLQLYSHYLEDITRLRAHTRSEEVEALLANARELGMASSNIYSMLCDADMKFAAIKGEDGEDVTLTRGRFISLMESRNRDVRIAAFNAFYDEFIKQKNTITAAYSSSVKKDVFFARERGYATSLARALSANKIPEAVYNNLLETVNKSLPVMHRYTRLRKKRLGLGELHMYDLYTPIVEDVDTNMRYEDACETVLKALEPLGEEYVSTVREAFKAGWVDVYENEGKRGGAYSTSCYDCHPYVLMNYDNKIDDMFTLAHEMGHAMHSWYINRTQPHVYSMYSIFLAEVASTVNEALLMEYLLKTTTDENSRKYLINYFMEQFRTTLFRQTMFAEFELMTHKAAENGEPLTVDYLNKIYRELNIKYYGPDIVVDDKIDMEWARIPHFYRAFYVYQYATGYSAAMAVSKAIMEKGDAAAGPYLEFLKSGSSDYPINVLRTAGVDMSAPKPVEDAMAIFQGLVEKMEALS
jgi:oligoendopeptidase F